MNIFGNMIALGLLAAGTTLMGQSGKNQQNLGLEAQRDNVESQGKRRLSQIDAEFKSQIPNLRFGNYTYSFGGLSSGGGNYQYNNLQLNYQSKKQDINLNTSNQVAGLTSQIEQNNNWWYGNILDKTFDIFKNVL
ncbi:hypothetical protein AB832_07520 [Flavobacteriaceae bacterium (ex Bugula neritina AB1)]|nr:hypothetical protein AB832_07520 [Flavobacteriaceae bacterium (ex Bugula neritina AB1)]